MMHCNLTMKKAQGYTWGLDVSISRLLLLESKFINCIVYASASQAGIVECN